MSELGIQQLQHYRDYIFEHEEEVKTLSREFLINVTKFFRDPEGFQCLKTEVIPAILSAKTLMTLLRFGLWRAAVVRKPYSVGILLMEHIGNTGKLFPNLKIFATDIDSEALETASRGVYTNDIKKGCAERAASEILYSRR
jgi:two-component system CheB/CheR fusion protein